MTVQLLTGSEALNRINSLDFQSRWLKLYNECSWATAFQHPDFVTAWYGLYCLNFLPVIVFAESDHRSFSGILTLALYADGKKLTVAGAQQAEYQGWIQVKDRGEIFIVKAVQKIRTLFPHADIHLRYLPPGMPLDGLKQLDGHANICSLRTHARPLMKIDAGAMERQRNKKNYRQNYNRLKRIGEVRFERILSHDDFIRVFDDLCFQYDFRQAAHFWNTPFISDPAKKKFYLALYKKGLLHVSILRVDKQVAASHIGLLTQGRAVHLSITTYNPELALHSPGNLLLAMLGLTMSQEGVPVLDLTPGGDKYKEHFATEYDVVSELTIYCDSRRRFRKELFASLVRFAKKTLQKSGCRAVDFSAAVRRLQCVRLHGLVSVAAMLRMRFSARTCSLRYVRARSESLGCEMSIGKNNLHDVCRFDSGGSSVRYCDFLRGVMKRLERSHCLYSYTQNATLLIYCWVKFSVESLPLQQSALLAAPQVRRIILFDFYVHPVLNGNELVPGFVTQILRDLEGSGCAEEIYYEGVLNSGLRAAFDECGFVDIADSPCGSV
ncbi:GNAT family N-acetyltransferase [Massilia sp. S19_KUP03_FR1]|uniref:GNAT family N-acetyltransferase n=1 Tax=Massilia sp. S19_KUP03_FR1 TaxID=3025503 RepID=UPI002FCD764E